MDYETAVLIWVLFVVLAVFYLLGNAIREDIASRKRKKRWEIHEKGTIADSLDKPEELK